MFARSIILLEGFLLALSATASQSFRGGQRPPVATRLARQLLFGDRDKDGDGDGIQNIFDGSDGDVCSYVEGLIDGNDEFDGDCTCEGNIVTSLTLTCTFRDVCETDDDEEDLPVVISNVESARCGSIQLSYTFSGFSNIDVSTCVDYANSDLERMCFSFQMTMTGGVPNDPTCQATYGLNDCECEMYDDFCIRLNCTKYLPGAETNACQMVNVLSSGTDVGDLLPRFSGPSPPEGPDGPPAEPGSGSGVNFGFWNVSVPDWINIDWENLSWSDLLDSLGIELEDFEICPAFERLIGMGEEFGAAGDCSCKGNLADGLVIGCNFERTCQDEEGDDVCGSVSIEFIFDNVGSVGVATCVDFTEDVYEEFCFNYTIPIADNSPPVCSASYGENSCGCNINGFCLSLDCSDHLEGAETDTCQILSISGDSARGFLPNLRLFDFNVSEIDFDNFGSWSDVIESVPPHIPVCTVVEVAVGITDAFVTEGDCKCSGTLDPEDVLSIDCSFPNVCRENQEDEETCGSVDFAVSVSDYDVASAEFCVDIEGLLPEVCLAYEIPITDSREKSQPTCSASIGRTKKQCGCSIDENFCFKIDCSEHAAGAVMDTCQQISLDGGAVPQNFVPSFAQMQDVDGSVGDGIDSGSSGDGTGSGTDGSNGSGTSNAEGTPSSGSFSMPLLTNSVILILVACAVSV